MRNVTSTKRMAMLAGAALSLVSVSVSAVGAMPIDQAGPSGIGVSPLVERTSAELHRVYPGSEDASRQQARAVRKAPNMFCEKHENECE